MRKERLAKIYYPVGRRKKVVYEEPAPPPPNAEKIIKTLLLEEDEESERAVRPSIHTMLLSMAFLKSSL